MRLTPYATVRENLSHILRNYDIEGQKNEIEKLSQLLGFEEYLDRTLKYLSGGEQQRISIAAALASNPSLLLMDEPFSQTDINLKSQLKDYLIDIVKELKVKILFVTHDPHEALSISDHIIIIHDGKILEEGNSKKLYFEPKNKLTAELTGYCNWVPESLSESTNAFKVENKYLVRPDQILISEQETIDSIKATITKIEFSGLYNVLLVKIINTEIILKAINISSIDFYIYQEVYLKFN